jgi:hypothetical protein
MPSVPQILREKLGEPKLPEEFACPVNLSPEGQQAWRVIVDTLLDLGVDADALPAVTRFYAPAAWEVKFGTDSQGALLYFDHTGLADQLPELEVKLERAGLALEPIMKNMSSVLRSSQVRDSLLRPALAKAATEFLAEELPPVGVPGAALRRQLRRAAARGETRQARQLRRLPRKLKQKLQQKLQLEASATMLPVDMAKSILRHLKLASDVKTPLPPGVLRNLEVASDLAQKLVSLYDQGDEGLSALAALKLKLGGASSRPGLHEGGDLT